MATSNKIGTRKSNIEHRKYQMCQYILLPPPSFNPESPPLIVELNQRFKCNRLLILIRLWSLKQFCRSITGRCKTGESLLSFLGQKYSGQKLKRKFRGFLLAQSLIWPAKLWIVFATKCLKQSRQHFIHPGDESRELKFTFGSLRVPLGVFSLVWGEGCKLIRLLARSKNLEVE